MIFNVIGRLREKSYQHTLMDRFMRNYSLSLVEAEVLSKDIIQEQQKANPNSMTDGQLFYTAVHKDEPAGKPITQCQKVRVKLTLFTPEDLIIPDIETRRSILVHRLSWEAIQQDGILTVEDLAQILITSESTIKRILKEYRKKDLFIPTRGNYHDIGKGLSHKAQAVRLFLKGFTPSEIAMRLSHNIGSVERYLDDFCVVMMGIQEGYSLPRIARNTKLSEKLVLEYAELYHQHNQNPDCQSALSRLSERLAILLKKEEIAILGIGGER